MDEELVKKLYEGFIHREIIIVYVIESITIGRERLTLDRHNHEDSGDTDETGIADLLVQDVGHY